MADEDPTRRIRQLEDQVANLQRQVQTYKQDEEALLRSRAKHVDIRYHFTREQVEKKNMRLGYCPTGEMIADVLTKGLSKHRFEKLRGACGVNQKH